MESNYVVSVEVGLRPNDVYTPFHWSRENLARWVAALFLAWIFYDLLHNRSDTLLSFQTGGSSLAVAILLAVFIVLGLLLFPYLRVLANLRKFPAMGAAHRLTFGPDSIKIESEAANSDCKWSLIQKAVETSSLFVLVFTTHGAMYVPKRSFSSHDEIVRLREIIRDALPGQMAPSPRLAE